MQTTENPVYQGGCLCGQVRYAISQFESKMAHCHCSMCRKFHGAAFASFASVKRENFQWLHGESELAAYQAPNGTVRRFCKHCGSSLTFAPSADAVEVVEISLGTLETPINQQPDAHIYVSSKADWDLITDGLPQYEEGRTTNQLNLCAGTYNLNSRNKGCSNSYQEEHHGCQIQ